MFWGMVMGKAPEAKSVPALVSAVEPEAKQSGWIYPANG